jgi:hypothetical protein
MEHDGMFVAWAVDPKQPGIALTKPFDGEAATVGNGVMVALLSTHRKRSMRFIRKPSSWAARMKVRQAHAAKDFMPVIFETLTATS